MTLSRYAARLARVTGAGVAAIGIAAALALGTTAASASPASASAATAAQTGWVRLAHFSPNTPAMDVYLYSFGDPSALIVLKHVAYGAVSAYQSVPAGEYTVAMRSAGASPGSQAAIATTINVTADTASTVAAIGPTATIKLQILSDKLAAPKGDSLVRVIQASTSQTSVTVTAGATVLGRGLAFGTATPYQTVDPGSVTVKATGGSESGSAALTLSAASVYSVVILDKPGGLQVTTLTDSAGMADPPAGGAQTGFGGTAPRPGVPLLPWLPIAAALAATAAAAAAASRLRHSRRSAPQER